MRRTGQSILGALFLVLVMELTLLGPADLKEKNNSQSHQGTKDNMHSEAVQQSMEGLHLVESQNESKEWELWADTAVGFTKKNDLSLSKVKANFFSDDGVSFEVIGATGAVITEAKNLKVGGGVLTKSSNGYTFKTTAVQYDSRKRYLRSDTPVDVIGPHESSGPGLRISGKEMEADLVKGVVLIQRDVKAKKSVADDKLMFVSAERVELSGKHREVHFSGDVVIDLEGMRISGPDALFRYDRENHQLESIDLEGGVKVSDLSKWATSDRLSINLEKNEFIFEGKPRVVQDNDELRGDRIVFQDGGKKVKVHNAKIKVSKEDKNARNGTKFWRKTCIKLLE